METTHKQVATNCPFVDFRYLMESGHEFDMQQHQAHCRDYKLHGENDYNAHLLSVLTETRSVVTIEESEDGRVPSEASADKEEAQELIKKFLSCLIQRLASKELIGGRIVKHCLQI
ncbi:c4346b25-3d45-4e5a-be32-d7d31b6a5e04-CDS [Sclerotinia trifoliorum]|uniref:C4346b25-3d45-4e5a-be32-d7d31b6a5e04-CDS n=1 Tax=Sclerotinia trifoliorum TaxID=28548 RepID=A0A8H2ZV48_9HELO|nr:c4346b25-3d45-4e5a-be32-d7d31b6a5e04-CDS [Sclerotinia trifoliorum]